MNQKSCSYVLLSLRLFKSETEFIIRFGVSYLFSRFRRLPIPLQLHTHIHGKKNNKKGKKKPSVISISYEKYQHNGYIFSIFLFFSKVIKDQCYKSALSLMHPELIFFSLLLRLLLLLCVTEINQVSPVFPKTPWWYFRMPVAGGKKKIKKKINFFFSFRRKPICKTKSQLEISSFWRN